MQIRKLIQSDSLDLFSWRNDELSRRMFKNTALLNLEDHEKWFEATRIDPNKYLLIGFDQNEKVGVCRFDLKIDEKIAEVSINVNPKLRSKGFGQELLKKSLKKFKDDFDFETVANVRRENIASIKVFEKCDFYFTDENDEYVSLKHKLPTIVNPDKGIYLEKIVNSSNQVNILFDLLNQRTHSISHRKMPSFAEHQKFVKSSPYRAWYLVFFKTKCIGSFYIQDDNSIGLNINELNVQKLNFCINFIKANYHPFPEKKSKIPGYFYLNAPFLDKNYLSLLQKLNLKPIQTSFRL